MNSVDAPMNSTDAKDNLDDVPSILEPKIMKKGQIAWSRLIVTTACLAVSQIQASGGSLDCEAASARAVEFLSNAHSGKRMAAEDWMTASARRAPSFAGFGGVDALVEQTTRRAKRYGGLKSVKVVSIERAGNECQVKLDVQFMVDPRVPTSPAVSEREDMVWTFKMSNVNGNWRISG